MFKFNSTLTTVYILITNWGRRRDTFQSSRCKYFPSLAASPFGTSGNGRTPYLDTLASANDWWILDRGGTERSLDLLCRVSRQFKCRKTSVELLSPLLCLVHGVDDGLGRTHGKRGERRVFCTKAGRFRASLSSINEKDQRLKMRNAACYLLRLMTDRAIWPLKN